jgi:hypothetical protein
VGVIGVERITEEKGHMGRFCELCFRARIIFY